MKVIPFPTYPVPSRLSPQEREAMQCDPLGEALVRALDFELNTPEFLRTLSQEQRNRMEESL